MAELRDNVRAGMTGRHEVDEGTHRRGAVNLETFAKRLAADRLTATAAQRVVVDRFRIIFARDKCRRSAKGLLGKSDR